MSSVFFGKKSCTLAVLFVVVCGMTLTKNCGIAIDTDRFVANKSAKLKVRVRTKS
jgi:hypothetical protein